MKIKRKWKWVFGILVLLLGGLLYIHEKFTKGMCYTYSPRTFIPGSINESIKFRDKYAFLPGDISNSQNIDDCTDIECFSGNGDGKVGENITLGYEFRDENINYWRHLGYDHKGEFCPSFLPPFKSIHIYPFYYDGKNDLPFMDSSYEEGHYLALIGNKKLNENSTIFSSHYAGRMDRQFDDGYPNSGYVLATGKPECFATDEQGKKVYKNDTHKTCAIVYYKFLTKQIEADIKRRERNHSGQNKASGE